MFGSTPSNPASRRAVLLGGAGAVGTAALAGSSLTRAWAAEGAGTRRGSGEVFTLGVASGDPAADSVVLWTRLAADPVAADGLGGMPNRRLRVQWEIAKDERFREVVRRGQAWASPESAHSVHVEAGGLRPGAEYFYRFRFRGEVSPAGRTRTTPAAGSLSALTMCFASCSHYGQGYFTAYRRMAEDEPGLILHLGDYQYEYPANQDSDVREVFGPETVELADYRLRHGQYKTDPDLQLAHATAPWLVVWDDHETENNWADETPEEGSQTPGGEFLARRAAAFKAYYEHMPLRSTSRPHGIDMRLYRRISWGGLANFHMLDTRQYRDDQACGDGRHAGCTERLEQDRTITGVEQRRWLLDGFQRTTARWDVLGQQVFFSQRDFAPGDEESFSMDAWDGYKADRDRIARAMGDSAVRNGVVLTGDVHRHWAAEIKASYDDPGAAGVGTEFVTTSVTSGQDGDDESNEKVLAENPHIKFYKNRRGYVRTRFSADELRVEHRVLPYVTRPGARATTAASFVIADGDPTLRHG